jgi:hypothetical protein
MELNKLNEILGNFSFKHNSKLKFIEKQKLHMGVSDSSYGGDGVQGEYDSYADIYKILSEEDLYLKVEYITDSYGDSARVESIQFVVPKVKTIQKYITL